MTDPINTTDAPLSGAASGESLAGGATPAGGAVPVVSPSPADLLADMKMGQDAGIDRAVEDAPKSPGPAELAAEIPAASAPTPADDAAAILSGRIANIGSQDVLIDFGGKSLGAMPLAEFDRGETYKVGDEIEVMVVDPTPVSGLIAVSRRKARQARLLRGIRIGTIVEGVVTGMNKGGLEVDIQGVGLRGFIPAAQVDVRFMKDISNLIGQPVKAEVMEIGEAAGEIVLSRRNYQVKEASEHKEHLIGELEVGQIRHGRVRSLSEFGAFVDIGGLDALLHVSDMSWGRVTKPEEVVKIGDEFDAKIIKINREKKKVSLSLREVIPDPWLTADQKYSVGAKLRAKVVRLQNFGAFVELEPGIDGLVPLSEFSWTRRITDPAEIVKEGEEIEVVVIGVDKDKKRISLSLKQITPDPWSLAAEKYVAGSMIKAKVARTTDFGAFVSLEDGIDGLIHISELSVQRVNAVTDKVKAGDEVEVRVLAVDPVNKRVALSLKPPPRQPTPEELEQIAKEKARVQREAEKRRTKSESRRGGLTISWDQGLGSLDPSKFAR